jgi:hypothetical protein
MANFWRGLFGRKARAAPPSARYADCARHGRQGIGLVCEHIAYAVDRGEKVGFYWGDDVDTARPDAWCAACEGSLRALNGASCEQWFVDARFKIFCAKCWDEAKATCGGFPPGPWPPAK